MWSARHGATSELPDLPRPSFDRFDAADGLEEFRGSPGPGAAEAPRAVSDGGSGRRNDAPMDRDAVLRLVWLRGFLCLGAALLLGSGATLAVVHAGAVSAVAGVTAVLALSGWLAVRGAPAARAVVGRFDRMRPAVRAVRPERLLAARPPAARG